MSFCQDSKGGRSDDSDWATDCNGHISLEMVKNRLDINHEHEEHC